MIADQHVREAVLDIHRSFLVQAPAGSGKTSLLVQRYLKLLANVQRYPEEILAITFTRKAAAEMRARVLEALQLAMCPAVSDDPYHQSMRELGQAVLQRDQTLEWHLLDNPGRLKIQTIDSLSSTIAAQMPITAQFGSNAQIEPNAEFLYRTAAEQVMLQASSNSPWLDDLNKLLLHLDNDHAKVQKLLVDMLACRDQWLPIVIGTLRQHGIRESLEDALQMVRDQALVNVTNNIPEVLDFTVLQCELPDSIEDWQQLSKILLTENHTWRKKVTAAHGFLPQSAARDKEEKLLFKQRKQQMEEILEQLEGCSLFQMQLIAILKLPPINYTDSQWHVLQALYTILQLVVAQLTLVFKEHGVVDFTEVTLAALRALDLQNSDLALALDCKIQHILVDEFQDTSVLQYSLLEKLTANWEPDGGKTLFLVGDPMQSIYRFRKAEVGLFLKAKQFGINQIKLNFAQLRVNFRSNANLIAWFNDTFISAFPDNDDIDFGAISYMPSIAARPADKEVEAVECYTAAALTEAIRIVEIIKESKANQPNASIAILVRAKAHLVDIIPALRAAEIPFCALELESLAQSQCIQDLLALTKALMHLDDRIAWLAVLRAPWCGLLLQDLLLIAEYDGTIWQAINTAALLLQLSKDAQQRLSKITVIFTKALIQIGRISLDIILQQLWLDLSGPHCLQQASLRDEAQIYFEFIEKHLHDPAITTPGFLEQQLQQLYLHVNHIKPDAVQIMTMHKAKGLEFDIVILPRLGKKIRGDTQKLLLLEQRNDPVEALIMAPIKSANEVHDSIYNYVMWCENKRHEYEALRQLYVAATRARCKLYCIGNVSKKGPSQQSLLASIWNHTKHKFIPVQPSPASQAKEKSKTSIYRLPIEYFKEPIAAIYPETSSYNDRNVTDPIQRIVGIVLHRTLWQIATEGVDAWDSARILQQEYNWVQHLRQLGLEPHNVEPALQLLTQAVNNTLNEQFAQQILSNKHQEAYAEWPLTVLHNGELNNVIIDRAFLDANQNFWIVDYKFVLNSDEIAAALQLYKAQMHKYFAIVNKQQKYKKIKKVLYFPLQAKWQEI